jgi:excisionase family DNA binding protein
MSAVDGEYLTVAEAATFLRVASSTIRRWIREGTFPPIALAGDGWPSSVRI